MSVKQQTSDAVAMRIDMCASGRSRADVLQELGEAKAAQQHLDRLVHRERVELCRKAWDAKYRGEYEFNPAAAYTSLIPGEKISKDLADQLYRVTQAIVALEEEAREQPDR